MLANYLIGLREGLEAALVVGIIIAYLVRINQRQRLPQVWAGVGIAVVVSLGVGALLTFGAYGLTFQAQEAIGGILSLIAVGFVTWMVFWMAKAGKHLSGDLRGGIDKALLSGSTFALVILAMLSVGREGLETALFVWSTVGPKHDGSLAFTGAVLGIVTAVVIEVLIYRGLVRINLSMFFTWTGYLLVIVAAGVLAYGIGDLQEAGLLPGLHAIAWDISSLVPPTSWYGTLLGAIVNFTPNPTWLQVIAWVLYIGSVFVLYTRATRPSRPAAPLPSSHAKESA